MTTAATEIVSVGDDVQRALRGEARDVSDAYYLMDRLESAAMDPTVALAAVTGMKLDALVYEFRVGGSPVSGITVKGAKALMSMRGGMEVLSADVQRETMMIETDEQGIIDIPAYRATVAVRDTRNDVTFRSSVVEPAVLLRRDGSTRLDNMADRKAVSKAERNAILDHFTKVTDIVEDFVAKAKQSGEALALGEPTADAERVTAQIEVNRMRREAKRHEPIGATEANLFRALVESTEAEAGIEKSRLVRDMTELMARNWPGLKLAEVPVTGLPVLEGWLREKRIKLGLEVEAVEEQADGSGTHAHATDGPQGEPVLFEEGEE